MTLATYLAEPYDTGRSWVTIGRTVAAVRFRAGLRSPVGSVSEDVLAQIRRHRALAGR